MQIRVEYFVKHVVIFYTTEGVPYYAKWYLNQVLAQQGIDIFKEDYPNQDAKYLEEISLTDFNKFTSVEKIQICSQE